MRTTANTDAAPRAGAVSIVGQTSTHDVAVTQTTGAPPTVLVNGVAKPGSISLWAANALTAQLVHAPAVGPFAVALFRADDGDWPGVPDAEWQHVTAASGQTEYTVPFTTPRTTGDFEVRWFGPDGTKLATSGVVHLNVPAPTLTVNGVGQGGALTVLPDATLTVQVTDEWANVQDFVALLPHGATDEDPVLRWAYLNGTHSAPATGISSASFGLQLPPGPASATYDLRLFANDSRIRLATGPTIETATPGGTGPNVTLTRPASSTNYQPGETITFTAYASDDGPRVSHVDFVVNGTPVGSASSSPWTIDAGCGRASPWMRYTVYMARPKNDTAVLTIRVPAALGRQIEREARRRKQTRSQVACALLEQSLNPAASRLAAEARRQSLHVSRQRSERDALRFIEAIADTAGWLDES